MARTLFNCTFACAAFVVSICRGAAHSENQMPLLLRDPSVSRTQITFSYANDIWIANRDGSDPRRLTSGGREAKPVFSPDGLQIAFAADYKGTRAVYVIPAVGGEPRRLTNHPADLGTVGFSPVPDSVGWTPDGKRIVFNSRRASFFTFTGQPFTVQLFTVPVEGGFVSPLPLARAAQASFSADGTHIAYVPNVQWHIAWKRYRGGQTTPIWIVRLADSSIEASIPRDNSNDFNPMWVGDTVYFLSDRDGPVTLFAYDVKSMRVRKIVENDGLDIKSAFASSDTIVYEQFGSLHLLDLESGENRTLDIRPLADFPEVQPHFKKIEPAQIRFADLSPTGERAVFGVRGEILTVPAESGDIRNLTHTADVVERDPAWSPNGLSVAYFSDESGEYALHISPQSGAGAVRKVNLSSPPAFYYGPTWSPDSLKIAYTDQRLNYWYVDIAKKTPVRVDTDLYTDPAHGLQMAWSPDSRWIAYTKQLRSHLHAVFVYSVDQAKSYQLTDGASDALHLAFDKGGDYLYLTASTDVALSTGGFDMTSLQRPVTRSVYLIVLNKAFSSPLVSAGEEPARSKSGNPAREENDSKVQIDLEGISHRIVALPIPARNYYDLIAGKAGTFFLVEGPQIEPTDSEGASTKVQKFDLNTCKTVQVLDDVTSFIEGSKHVSSLRLSFSGEKMLYARDGQWFIGSVEKQTAGLPRQKFDDQLNLQDLSVYVDPRAEWKHMYEQVWRDERDFFYDPGVHGLSLKRLMREYEAYLPNIVTRDDLNYLFNEMLGNVTVGHMVAFGGDNIVPKRTKTGLLGADFTAENARYRFARIYAGDPWDPQTQAPLTRPGLSVQVGEYLLAVDGRDVRPTADVYDFFEGTAGKHVVLTVGPRPDRAGSRDVTVAPVEDDTALRNYAWVEHNRREVDNLSHGRVAYVYLPDTDEHGYTSFNRDYFAQVGKDAAIVDARYNAGGLTADYIVDYLRRPLMNYWHMRYGTDVSSPQEAIFGPKVMIINEMAGSGGDGLPWMFRKAGIGPLIGKRTWGGLVGGYTLPDDLLDGGIVTTPNLAFYNRDGAWDIENHGVSPDIEVEQDPKAVRAGQDPQLEKAVEITLKLLKESPPTPTPQHPPYPNYQTSVR